MHSTSCVSPIKQLKRIPVFSLPTKTAFSSSCSSNLAHHAVQRLRVSLGATRKHLPESYDPRELVQNSSTEQLRTIIRYLLDTLLSLLHCCNGEGGSRSQLHLTLKKNDITFELTFLHSLV